MGSTRIDIAFSCGKDEKFTPENGLRILVKRLRQNWTVERFKNVFTDDVLSRSRLIIFVGPQRKFSTTEFAALRQFLGKMGNVMFLLGEGGEEGAKTNANYFLEEYGMVFNNDAVIRNVFHKYFVPKEAVITDGYIQRISTDSAEKDQNQGAFLFPYGATMNVKKPAIPLLTTGAACYPMHRPICAFYSVGKSGRVMALSSVQILHDNFVEKENNITLLERLLNLIFSEKLPRVLPDESDIPENEPFLDIADMANRVTPVLETTITLPKDLTKLLDSSYELTDLIKLADVLQAYSDLNIQHEPLSLIAPKFEGTFLPLELAIYPPVFEDLPRPELEMFDFNKEFGSEREKLTQLYIEHPPQAGLPQYIMKAASSLSIGPSSSSPVRGAKEVVEYVAAHVLANKRAGWME